MSLVKCYYKLSTFRDGLKHHILTGYKREAKKVYKILPQKCPDRIYGALIITKSVIIVHLVYRAEPFTKLMNDQISIAQPSSWCKFLLSTYELQQQH